MKNKISIADLFGEKTQLAFWQLRQRAEAVEMENADLLSALKAAIRCGDVEVDSETKDIRWMGADLLTPQTAAQ